LALAHVAEVVGEALSLISKACRSECVRDICESLEDTLMTLLDEAGDPDNITPLAGEAVGRASEELKSAAADAEARGCREEARLLREASRLLESLHRSLIQQPL
jgi:hypothetical protein